MARQLFVSVLLGLYCLSAIGVPLHLHYCRGELQNISLFVRSGCAEMPEAQAHKCCNELPAQCATEHAKNHCCDNDTRWLKEDVPVVCTELSIPGSKVVAAPLATSEVTLPQGDAYVSYATAHRYPPGNAPPSYLLHCALIFYS